MPLDSLQRQLSDAIFRRQLLDESLDIKGGEAAFAIYRNNIFVSLINVLRGLYPVTAELCGDAFSDMARDYISTHPPMAPHLLRYGGDFPDFIGAIHVAWGQVAGLEKLCNLSYGAEASDVVTAERLLAYSEEERLQLPLGLSHSCFVSQPLPDELVQAFCDNAVTRATIESTTDTTTDKQKISHALIFRPAMAVVKKVISPPIAAFLNGVKEGDFSSAMADFMEADSSAEQSLAELFHWGVFALP